MRQSEIHKKQMVGLVFSHLCEQIVMFTFACYTILKLFNRQEVFN